MNVTISEAKQLAKMLATELSEAKKGMLYEEAYQVIEDCQNTLDSMAEDIGQYIRPRRQAGFLAKW